MFKLFDRVLHHARLYIPIPTMITFIYQSSVGGGTNDMSDWICRVAVKEFRPVVQVKAFNKAFSDALAF
jgi:hypothetical protein